MKMFIDKKKDKAHAFVFIAVNVIYQQVSFSEARVEPTFFFFF